MFNTRWNLLAMGSMGTLMMLSNLSIAASINLTAKNQSGIEKYTYSVGEPIVFEGSFSAGNNRQDQKKYGWNLGNGCGVTITRKDSQGWVNETQNAPYWYIWDDTFTLTNPSSTACPNLKTTSLTYSYQTAGTYNVSYHAFELTSAIDAAGTYYYFEIHQAVAKTIVIQPQSKSTAFLVPLINSLLE